MRHVDESKLPVGWLPGDDVPEEAYYTDGELDADIEQIFVEKMPRWHFTSGGMVRGDRPEGEPEESWTPPTSSELTGKNITDLIARMQLPVPKLPPLPTTDVIASHGALAGPGVVAQPGGVFFRVNPVTEEQAAKIRATILALVEKMGPFPGRMAALPGTYLARVVEENARQQERQQEREAKKRYLVEFQSIYGPRTDRQLAEDILDEMRLTNDE